MSRIVQRESSCRAIRRGRLRWSAAPLSGAIALATLAAGPAGAAERTRYPLTFENCGRDLTIREAPRRAVSLGQGTTEILLSLGLAERVAGTAVWLGPVPAPLAAENARIPRLSDNQPSFEAVLGVEPDLVAAQWYADVGTNGRVASWDRFKGIGVETYVSPVDCAKTRKSPQGDGTRAALISTEALYREVAELGAVFDVADRAERLIADLRVREGRAAAIAAGARARNVSVVYWFSSPTLSGPAYVAGRHGAPAFLSERLGLRNVIESDEEWPLVGWESIAALDPTIIVLGSMDRRRLPGDDAAAKLRFLREDPVLGRLEAVRKDRIVLMDAQSMNPTLRMIDGIELLANRTRALGLAE